MFESSYVVDSTVPTMEEAEARALLRRHGLRATAPRLAVLRRLSQAEGPLSFTDVVEGGDSLPADRATVYRNLIKLCEVGIAVVAERVDGRDRYVLASAPDDEHRHAHFVCRDCGRVDCLPEELTSSLAMDGPWGASIRRAMVQLRGECPDCLEAGEGP